jgi:hypothetical protein
VNSQKLDEHAYAWLVQKRVKNISISEPILKKKLMKYLKL